MLNIFLVLLAQIEETIELAKDNIGYGLLASGSVYAVRLSRSSSREAIAVYTRARKDAEATLAAERAEHAAEKAAWLDHKSNMQATIDNLTERLNKYPN